MVDPLHRARAEQLHDRVGHVRDIRGTAPLVADDLERLTGRGGPIGGGEDLDREVGAPGPKSQAVRTIATRPEPPAAA